MKKLIAIMLALMLLAGCGQSPAMASGDLMEGIRSRSVATVDDLTQDRAAVTDFGLDLFRQTMTGEDNTLISPLSVLYALSMTANGADGQTLAQMEQVLGLDVETLNSWLHTYMAKLPQKKESQLRLANAIWFKDDPGLTVEEAFLQAGADYYDADIYRAPFHVATLGDINNWVNTKTDGMIPEVLDEIPENVMLYLVNALAFQAQWESVYQDVQVRNGFFTAWSGETQEVQMMHSEEHTYLEDENAAGFIKYYADRDYAFVALLPEEGVSVAKYMAGLTGERLQQMLTDAQDITVFASMPKFEIEYEVEMSETLIQMGMTDAFDWTVADFSRMGTVTDGNLCISQVLHKTFLSVAEQGTKAGAVTVVETPAAGEMLVPEHKEVELDRPFVYMLIDCETNLPFFIGTMTAVNVK